MRLLRRWIDVDLVNRVSQSSVPKYAEMDGPEIIIYSCKYI